MKSVFGIITVTAMALVVTLSGCRKVVRDVTRGQVDEINDSAMVVRIDGDKVIFDIREAQFTNGAVMYDDSVIINYIGDLSMGRAFAESVRLIERPSRIIIIDKEKVKNDTTAPVTRAPKDGDLKVAKRKQRQEERMVRYAKKFAK